MPQTQPVFSNVFSQYASNLSHISHPARPTKVAVIGTYAPRKCGIATFTEDLVTQVSAHHPNIVFDLYALDRAESALGYEPGVEVIAEGDPEAYRAAADRINRSGADAIWLQHEFGIFGGTDGAFIAELVERIAAPLIVTFHTILSEPNENQRAIVRRLLTRANEAMVMSQHGRNLLIEAYGAAPDSVTIIPHGAPDRPFGRAGEFKDRMGLADRPVLMTFGLLGPGKGIEHAIDALPAIAAKYPDVVYRIVGATHPNLVRAEGERYRDSLKARVAKLGISDNVHWDERFLDTEALLDQLEACDIYLTPYPNLQQSTSGTLSYAVALGKAVVSTPYIHARELLAGGVGCLVPVGKPEAIASTVNALLGDGERLLEVQRRAYERGRSTIWPEFAKASASLVNAAAESGAQDPTLVSPRPAFAFGEHGAGGLITRSDLLRFVPGGRALQSEVPATQ